MSIDVWDCSAPGFAFEGANIGSENIVRSLDVTRFDGTVFNKVFRNEVLETSCRGSHDYVLDSTGLFSLVDTAPGVLALFVGDGGQEGEHAIRGVV